MVTDLYRENCDKLRSYVLRMLKSPADADDVVHDAFVRFYRSDVFAYDNPRAVLFKTAWRLALNRIRSRRSNPVDRADTLIDELTQYPCAAVSAEEDIISREKESVFRAAIASLPPRCRQVIELRTMQELSFREMSDRLGISVSTLEKHMARGKRACIEAVSVGYDHESRAYATPSAVAA
ncbi:sigma-70 family RNA polymerase sigma factor [Parasphingopyxis sp. GrpM-11]|uniref:Sigma-70 family RNA polymerase sigma factor n=1 Tax=Parasphingopyxis marina TaxID=2761622 RepID=A0A842I0C7_9SPHN|nr:sigma-70 family RNA polymerase sigma factor [Parasphingopyxis marina]